MFIANYLISKMGKDEMKLNYTNYVKITFTLENDLKIAQKS